MELVSQKSAIESLERLAKSDRHTILISGIEGSGKTYLAKHFSKLINAIDFVEVESKVVELKSAIDTCLYLKNKIVLCVENLDLGVSAAASTILKFIEEPKDNVYTVITCRNKYNIPSTIMSRSIDIEITPPTESDIKEYCQHNYISSFESISRLKLYRSIKSYSDADTIFKLNKEQLDYFKKFNLSSMVKQPVSAISWNLSHFPDNSSAPTNIVIKYIMRCNIENIHIVRACLDALNQLNNKRVAPYIVLNKLAFELKYGE